MSPEEHENFKVLVFNAMQNLKSTPRRQALPKRSATITTESQGSGYCHQQHSCLPAAKRVQPPVEATVSTTHQVLLVLETLHQ